MYSELFCMGTEKQICFHSLKCQCSALIAQVLPFFPVYISDSFVKDWVSSDMWIYLWVLYSVLLVSVFFFCHYSVDHVTVAL